MKKEEITNKIKNILNDNINFVFLISFFNSFFFGIHRYFILEKRDIIYSFIKVLYLFLGLSFFTLGIVVILGLILGKIEKLIIYILTLISLVLFFIDMQLLLNFKTIINRQTVQVFFESNSEESIEFLKQYFKFFTLIEIIVVILISYMILKIKFRITSKKIVYLICILSICQLIVYKPIFRVATISRLIMFSSNSYDNIKKYKKLVSKMNNTVEIIDDNSNIKNIILIIGESTDKNHMKLYGYDKDTTPRLNALKNNNELYVFNDIISPHSHTLAVLRKALTFYNKASKDEWYNYNNLVDVMKKANYKTYWFSNQESMGESGNIAAAIGNRSDIVLFNEHRDTSETKNKFDEEIVDKSTDFINYNQKNFVVYHLLGTHYLYKYRYPEKFNKFNFKDYNNRNDLKENQKQILAEYDNAVLYNDFVVNKIIQKFKDKESIIIYFSDHGEEVYDFRNFVGHAETNLSRYMVEIPFMIYISDKFKEKHPKKVKQIKNAINRPYMTDDVIHTILDLSDIKTTEFDETKSVINDKFENKERIIGGKSYEGYWKNLN